MLWPCCLIYLGSIANPASVTQSTPMKPNIPVMLVAAALALPIAITATAQNDARDLAADPARWTEPIKSPRERYENSTKEAAAALAEALKECKGRLSERKACIAEARAQHKRDVEAARASAGDTPHS